MAAHYNPTPKLAPPPSPRPNGLPTTGATFASTPSRAARTLPLSVQALVLLVLFLGMGANGVEEYPVPSEPPASASSSTPITLPVEVIGPDGYTASVSVEVPSPGEVDRLYLRLHRPVYRDASVNPGRGAKASVRLNNGPWIDITNQTVDVYDHEAEYGGLNGTYHTLRMTLPISALGTPQAGGNTLAFRFNGTDGHTSGYRVLEFNFLRSGGSEILPATAFVEDDPTLWEPISSNPADIAAGEQLWRSGQLVERPGGPSIQASCSSCHAHDGRDLWYFAYSNESIVARSEFHGLSQDEAEKVASYIRSLQDSDPTYAYDPPGRPWNPPYQPGPGLDALPAHEWAAGAGLEWVMEDEEDTIPYMFPSGTINKDDLATDGLVNMREIPVAMQFPDWNDWLPEEHPVDIWGSTFTNDQSNQAYLNARSSLAGGVNVNTVGDLVNEITDQTRRFWRFRGSQDPYRANGDTPEVERRHRSQFHWATVKTWELMQEWELEGLAPQVYPGYGEARSWFGGARNLFELAPHLATNKAEKGFSWQTDLVGKYWSTAWYQVQLVVNAGNTVNATAINPVDWNYHPAHIADLHGAGGPKHPVRQLLSLAKMNQVFHHYEVMNQAGIAQFGIMWGQAHPARYNPNRDGIWDGIAPHTLARLYDAVLGAWMDRLDQHAYNSFDRRADTNGDGRWCDEGQPQLKPTSWNGDVNTGSGCSHDWGNPNMLNSQSALSQRRYAETWFHMIPVYRQTGVSESTLTRLIDWGEAMWPLGEWDDLRVETTSEHPVAGDDAATVVAGGTVTISVLANDSDPDGTLDIGSVTVTSAPGHGTATADPSTGRITYVHDGSATGNDTFTYTVADDEGNPSNQATVSIAVLAGAETHHVQLQSGWNTVALRVTPENPAFADLFSEAGRLVMVKDALGQVFFPEHGIDQLGTWDSTQAYKVLVDDDTTLAVQGAPIVPMETPIPLYEGWNLLPFFLDAPQPVEEALASILADLNYLTDEEDGVFDPGAGINTIGMLEPGRGYRAHLAQDATLVYPSGGGRSGVSTTSAQARPDGP